MCRIPRIVSSQDWNSECSPCFPTLFSTPGGPFRCLFRYRARLPPPHPGRACSVAVSRAHVAGVGAELCQTG